MWRALFLVTSAAVLIGGGCGQNNGASPDAVKATAEVTAPTTSTTTGTTAAPTTTTALTTTTTDPLPAAREAYRKILLDAKPLFDQAEAFKDANGLIPWVSFPQYCVPEEAASKMVAKAMAEAVWPPSVKVEADAYAKAVSRDAETARQCAKLPGTREAQSIYSQQFYDNRAGGYRAEFELALGIKR